MISPSIVGYLFPRIRPALILLTSLTVTLSGCAIENTDITPTPAVIIQPSPTPALPIDDRIRDSYRESDPLTRKEDVLRVTEAFLRHSSVAAMNDEEASQHYTGVAFSSERLTFSDPAFIRRRNDLAVVGLPDGLGLYLYDLSVGSSGEPLLLSQWTIGLSAVEVIWRRSEMGISYLTIGNDGLTRLHFVLVNQRQGQWRVAWFSDEQPDWWFNIYDATISVNNDLSRLVIIGKAYDTTLVFDEDAGVQPFPLRDFRVEWERDGDSFFVRPTADLYPHREAWLWDIAQPSAYATLVEFLERLRLTRYKDEDLLPLVTGQEVIDDARAFGLYLPERRFTMLAYDENIVVFRDRRGAFVATLHAPSATGEDWLVASIRPLGAGEGGPEPEATPRP